MDRMLGQWPSLADQQSPLDREFIGLSDITAFLRQYIHSIAGCLGIGILGAGLYIATTDPIFTARTQILIEPKIPQLLQQPAAEVNLSLDTAQVESQIAVMRSEKIARMVIDELKLLDDPKFNQWRSPTMADRVRNLTAAIADALGFKASGKTQVPAPSAEVPASGSADELPPETSEFERSRRTMRIFQDGLDIRRVGVSYAIEISFRSPDAEEAAKIANATANALVREQLETKAAAAREGGAWLERRIKELRTQMNTATQVAQEFRAKHDYRVGRQLGAAIVEGQVIYDEQASEDGPTLEELEVTADTYRKMYESFLQAYTSSVSRQSYPVADARVITAATRPLVPSHPRRKLVMVFGALTGIMVGVALAFVRHTLDRTIRSPRHVREEFGLDCIGELPAVKGRKGGFALLDEVAKYPQSNYSKNLRTVTTAISMADTAHPIRHLGITSALPGDGKSSCASNLAMLYSMRGMRTLVIDADIFHSTLTNRLLAAPSTPEKHGTFAESTARFIAPAVNRGFDLLRSPVSAAKDLLVSNNMQTLLQDLQCYDMVIVDLPPLTSGAESLAVSSLLDGVILVAAWGQTPAHMLGELVRLMQATKTPIIGVLMTKVRIMSTRRYSGFENQQPH
jgi:uncharacterized protein involved in exopolysaccharide biosynthesis/Mrp family chromosome partitioning ATPase